MAATTLNIHLRVFYLCFPNKLHDNIHISQTTHEINGYQTGLVVPVCVWRPDLLDYGVTMTEEQVARHDGKSWPLSRGGWLRSFETRAASRSPSRVKGLHSLEVKYTTRGGGVSTREAQHWMRWFHVTKGDCS